MRILLKRVFLALITFELLYLALVNLALNLPFTQSLINQHKPEKYAVSWEKAWSWYPFRVHAQGISINGQTSTLHWQADVASGSAAMRILPLLQRTVSIRDVDAADVSFRLRPRPRPGRDYARTRQFFPPIEGRDPDSSAVPRPARKPGPGWRVVAEGVRARGVHQIWILNLQGAFSGDLHGSVSYETRGGPFSLNDGDANLRVETVRINEEWELVRSGALEGQFELSPFVPSENRGWRALAFLTADAIVDLQVDSLDFLDFYTRRFNGLAIDGKGEVTGRLSYAKGNLGPGTDLEIPASELVVAAIDHELRGEGKVRARVTADAPDILELDIGFGSLDAYHIDDDAVPLFVGEGLRLGATGTNRILPDDERVSGHGKVLVALPEVTVPDLRALQRYIPTPWKVGIMGGQGVLSGDAVISADDLDVALDLSSSDAGVAFRDYRFQSDLEVRLRMDADASDKAIFDLTGTHLRLDDARLTNVEEEAPEPWRMALSIEQGTVEIPVPDGGNGQTGIGRVARSIKEKTLPSMLTSANAEFDARLNVSSLSWINAFIRSPLHVAVAGSGEAQASVRIESGWLAEGTRLDARPDDLTVEFLDYAVEGDGAVELEVEDGGEQVALRLAMAVEQGVLRRRDEEAAFVEDVALDVMARVGAVDFSKRGELTELHVALPSARLTDATVYNDYLPAAAPLRVLAGEGELSADIRLERESADGFLKFSTTALTVSLDEQQVAGNLALDVNIAGGVPEDMSFDISGSSLTLDDFRVTGEQVQFEDRTWTARFELPSARAVWRRPVRLDIDAEVALSDSRPIVAMFANQRGKEGWLEKLLTIEDVRGKAQLRVADDRIVVPYALAGSDKIDVGAKGVIENDQREGVFYARYRDLHGLMKLQDGDRNFDILKPREKFDGYSPGMTTVEGEPLAE